uniref:hypothetical protein n=1 Tax=Aliarcobacter butzleri TaxID=28197 RepID=UPI001868614A
TPRILFNYSTGQMFMHLCGQVHASQHENKFQLKFEIFWDLQHNIFRVENLLPAFKVLYGGRNFSTNSELLRELQKYNPSLFGMSNIQTCIVNNEQKYFFNLEQMLIR